MNPWIKKLQETLTTEDIASDPEKSRVVPEQYYADGLSEFIGQLKGFIKSGRRADISLTVFVDGVSKKCTEGGEADIDEVFRKTLRSTGFSIDWIVLSELLGVAPAELHASHDIVEKTRDVVHSRTSGYYIILGSGSITDVVKHAVFLEGIAAPIISVPTALTVTAFTSAFSIIDFHGAKRTQVSREIAATFWVKSILECAPLRMSRAGYGDLLARFVAYGDWYLGKCLGVMDRYDECALRLMEPFADGIKGNASGFLRYPLPPETIQCVSASLAMAGIAMSVSGETTPLSGFEHVISHGLDFLRLTSGRELVFHGEQVALGCLTSARAIDWLLEKKSLEASGWLSDPVGNGLKILNDLIETAPLPSSREKIENARQEFIREYEKKSKRWQQELETGRKDRFIKEWPEIKKNLARVTLRASDIAPLMKQAGLPMSSGETLPSTTQEEYVWAVRFSPFVRSRTNISDLIFWMGEDITQFVSQ